MTPDLERDGYVILPGAVPQDAVRAALRCIGLGIRRHGLPGGAEHARCQGGTFLPELRDETEIWDLLDGCAEVAHIPLEADWAEPQILLRFPDEEPCNECERGVVFVGHGDCGGCSGIPSPQHEPACGVEPCPNGCPVGRPALVPHVDEEPAWAGHEFVFNEKRAQWDECWHMTPCPDGFGNHPCGAAKSDPIHGRRRYKAIVGVALTDHGPDDGALHVWRGSHDGPLQRCIPVPVPLRAGDAVVMHPKLAHAGSLNLGSTWQARVYFRMLAAAEERRDA